MVQYGRNMVRYKPTVQSTHLQHPGRVAQEGPFIARQIVFSLLGVAAILGWLYVFFMSDLFTINRMEVRGVSLLDPMEVTREGFAVLDQRRGWRPWSTRHALFLDQEQFEENLKERLFAERVTVDNIDSRILRLIIEERAKRVVFYSHQQYFWVDLSGVVTDELTPNERTTVQARLLGHRAAAVTDPPVIHRDLDEEIAPGYVIDQPERVRDWIRLSSQMMKSGLLYRELEPPANASSTIASITAPEGYEILVDMDSPIQPQLDTYLAFKRAQTKTKVSEYLDVRIPGRVYLK